MRRCLASIVLPLCACVAHAACSSDDGVAGQRQLGGSGGVGGAASDSGSSDAAAGSGGTSGDASLQPPVCEQYCSTLGSTTCSSPPDAAACVQFCEAALDLTSQRGCGNETESSVACHADYPAASYTCDASGSPALPADACQAENTAMDACLCHAACLAVAATGCPGFTQAGCDSFCIQLGESCPACRSAFVSLLICEAGQPATAFQCNATGNAELRPETCSAQVASWQSCTTSQCPAP